ncbi:MAG: intradiol ring-cleavage dioxygenase [Sphingomonadales bacterium]|nr:intradiol ring-cleavage dioxygenase [Sphingomonadales bacterium]NCQ20189.1 intradiol ring-cleavage dioxygenase [Sphingomonadales bacterium]NCT02952.1 intradiol ring-cleavage dioxygenase [Sphingomonadales bacterium]
MKSLGKPLSRRAFAGSALAAGAFAATRGMAQAPAVVPTMDSQMGPFYPLGYSGEDDFDMTMLKGRTTRALGEVIEVTGRVLDRFGNPMKNAAIEIWQANHVGRYDHANDQNPAPLDPNFQGVARLVTGASGEWRIRTIKPKFYDTPLGLRTPHIHFDVIGSAQRLVTQMYFPEETEANAKDFLYKDLGPGAPTLVAQRPAPATYRWDIVLMDAVV